MRYDLARLDPKAFERLSQALLRAEHGSLITMFGDGRDGGREATWNGTLESYYGPDDWTGYGVIQAKHREGDHDPADNLQWIKKQIGPELKSWATRSQEQRCPDYLLFVTGVRLSSVPGYGIDAANKYVRDQIQKHALPIRAFRILHFDDVSRLLDNHQEIRRTYAASVTPGDVLTALLDSTVEEEAELKRLLLEHAARSLVDEDLLNLTQAGSVSDAQASVLDTFVDLPLSVNDELNFEFAEQPGGDPTSILDSVDPDLAELKAAAYLIRKADRAHSQGSEEKQEEKARRTVLVGGPGQGKSTVTQFLAQVYRANILRGTAMEQGDVARVLRTVKECRERVSDVDPMKWRWPVRIVLPSLADALQREEKGVLGYLAQRVSERSSGVVTAGHLRKWLSKYPWLVLIDGFDEVPSSSNRADVLRAIQDFYIEAASLGADVVVVCTTRPQGYSQEFTPDLYEHISLAKLKKEQSSEFATRYITNRVGNNAEKSRSLLEKFQSALTHESSARLLNTPLQVTIMVLLLEKFGRAPKDRWQLFSNYYDVIFAREQEKPGELAELIADFQGDINFLHKQIGYVLQERSGEAGETSSLMPREEFESLIEARLKAQGHGEDEARRLRENFSRLVTDRLVFLSFVVGEDVGFELRSLQEFMAGEYIVALPEIEIMEDLERRAKESHWRNAALFALGHVFARRDHLKAEAILLLDRLNNDSLPDRRPGVGADLAIALIEDGACATQPKYDVELAVRGAAALDLEVNRKAMLRLSELAVTSAPLERVLRRALADFRDFGNGSAVVNRLILADGIFGQFSEDAQAFVDRVMASAASGRIIETMSVRAANDGLIVRAADSLAATMTNVALLRSLAPRATGRDAAPGVPVGASARFIDAWRLVATSRHWIVRGSQLPGQEDSSVFRHTLTRLVPEKRAIAGLHLGGLLDAHDDTSAPLISAVIAFLDRPDEATLSTLLQEFANSPDGEVFSRLLGAALPWPAAACLNSASMVRKAIGSAAACDWLRLLATEAREGSLGARECWVLAEEEWFGRSEWATAYSAPVEVRTLNEVDIRLPFSANLSGFQPPGGAVFVSLMHQPALNTVEAARAILDSIQLSTSAFDDSAYDRAFFLLAVALSVLREPEFREGEGPEGFGVSPEISEAVTALVPRVAEIESWIAGSAFSALRNSPRECGWLGALSPEAFEAVDGEAWIDRAAGAVHDWSLRGARVHSRVAFEEWKRSPSREGLLKFVLRVNPVMAALERDDVLRLCAGLDVADAARVFTASVEALRSGRLDSDLLSLAKGFAVSDAHWADFLVAVDRRGHEFSEVLLLRLAYCGLRTHPLLVASALSSV